MIEIYTGFVGSGKSYHATAEGCRIADAPASNRYVVANFPIKPRLKLLARIPIIKRYVKEKYNKPRWIYKTNDELCPDVLIRMSYEKGWNKKEGSCLLIIDEAGVFFNARDWNVRPAERRAWINFFAQSRKLGFDIILIAQDVRMIDRQIRSLCEYEVQHKKLNNMIFLGMLPVTIFAAVKFWNGIRTLRGSLTLTIYRKAVAERYDTKALFGYADYIPPAPAGEGGTAQAGGSLPEAAGG